MSGRPACLHRGHDFICLLGLGVVLYGGLYGGLVPLVGLRYLLADARIIFASSEVRISSSRGVRAWDISGLMEARVRDLSSVSYLCFTRLGTLGG